MNIKEILEFKLIELENFELSLYALFMAIGIIAGTHIGLKVVHSIFKKRWKYNDFDSGRSHSFFQIVRYFVWIIAGSITLGTIGIDITFLIGASAALFVGLGFALQNLFRDLISGIFLLFEGAIKVDDIVEVDGIVGKVKEIDLRASLITTREDIVMVIPNHKFVAENVINWSHNSALTRFEVSVGVAYGSDTQLVKETLSECAKQHPDVSSKHEPIIWFRNFGDSSLDFTVLFWSTNAFRIEGVKSDLRFAIDKAFRDKGITIPFPQRDLHMIPSPANNQVK